MIGRHSAIGVEVHTQKGEHVSGPTTLRRFTLHLALAAAAASLVATSGAARAATVASDFVLPIWQGTSTSTGALGHQFACTTSGCSFSIYTITTGSNCAVESITNPASGIGGANTYQNTACVLEIRGSASFTEVFGQSCHFTPDNVYVNDWTSGVNSTLFSSSGYPLIATMVPLTTASGQLLPNQYVLTVKQVGAGLSLNGHVITMNERFIVKFNRATLRCPNPDGYTSLNGNIYDPVADVNLSGRDGYFTDTVAVL